VHLIHIIPLAFLFPRPLPLPPLVFILVLILGVFLVAPPVALLVFPEHGTTRGSNSEYLGDFLNVRLDVPVQIPGTNWIRVRYPTP